MTQFYCSIHEDLDGHIDPWAAVHFNAREGLSGHHRGVIYISGLAHGWSVDGTGTVTPSVAGLKDLFGDLCCRSCTTYTVGALPSFAKSVP